MWYERNELLYVRQDGKFQLKTVVAGCIAKNGGQFLLAKRKVNQAAFIAAKQARGELLG